MMHWIVGTLVLVVVGVLSFVFGFYLTLFSLFAWMDRDPLLKVFLPLAVLCWSILVVVGIIGGHV